MVKTAVFKMLGTTDERTSCDCCGRSNLKKTVALEAIDAGEIYYYGTSCAAKALRWTAKEVRSAAKDADAAKDAERRAAKDAERRAESARWQAFLDSAAGPLRDFGGAPDRFRQLETLGGYAAARELYKKSTEFA